MFLLPLCCLINNIAYDDRFRKEGDNMHKFMRTIGFSMYQKKQDMEKLLRRLAKEAERIGQLSEREAVRSANCGQRQPLAWVLPWLVR